MKRGWLFFALLTISVGLCSCKDEAAGARTPQEVVLDFHETLQQGNREAILGLVYPASRERYEKMFDKLEEEGLSLAEVLQDMGSPVLAWQDEERGGAEYYVKDEEGHIYSIYLRLDKDGAWKIRDF